jgi:hypothetical protein
LQKKKWVVVQKKSKTPKRGLNFWMEIHRRPRQIPTQSVSDLGRGRLESNSRSILAFTLRG